MIFLCKCAEISEVSFHSLDNLPKSCYGVYPFLPKLKRWISKNIVTVKENRKSKKAKKSSKAPTSDNGAKCSLSKEFDQRNSETFADDGGAKGWTVHDMFSANAKLTGRTYDYDGNPHTFGSYHPRYQNYNSQSMVSSSSASAFPACEGSGSTVSETVSVKCDKRSAKQMMTPVAILKRKTADILRADGASTSLTSTSTAVSGTGNENGESDDAVLQHVKWFTKRLVFDAASIMAAIDAALSAQPLPDDDALSDSY